jgi:hypothetical protein
VYDAAAASVAATLVDLVDGRQVPLGSLPGHRQHWLPRLGFRRGPALGRWCRDALRLGRATRTAGRAPSRAGPGRGGCPRPELGRHRRRKQGRHAVGRRPGDRSVGFARVLRRSRR